MKNRDLMDWAQTGSQVYTAAQLGKIAGYLERRESEEEQARNAAAAVQSLRQNIASLRRDVQSLYPQNLYGLFRLRDMRDRVARKSNVDAETEAYALEYLECRIASIERALPAEISADLEMFFNWCRTRRVWGRVKEFRKMALPRPERFWSGVLVVIGALALAVALLQLNSDSAFGYIVAGAAAILAGCYVGAGAWSSSCAPFHEGDLDDLRAAATLGFISDREASARCIDDEAGFCASFEQRRPEIEALPISQMYEAEMCAYGSTRRFERPSDRGRDDARADFEQRYGDGRSAIVSV